MMSQLVKYLLGKHGDLSSDPALKPGMVVHVCNPSSGVSVGLGVGLGMR